LNAIFINKGIMNNKEKHNLNESYLQTLTEEERVRQMSEWTPSEWQQYYCPNGTMTLDEVMDYIKNNASKIITEKYGSNIQ
jgi:Zn/Cd-binding protein ZinT